MTRRSRMALSGSFRAAIVRESFRIFVSHGSNDLAISPDEEGISIEVSAGSVVAFSSLMLHATGANRTDKPRRVYLAQYTAEAMLNPGTRQLPPEPPIRLLDHGRQVSIA